MDNSQQEIISSQRSTISDLEKRLAERDRQLSEVRASTSSTTTTSGLSSELFPPNAEPGHCYARILTPAVYKTSQETVLAKEASERVEIIPATYEPATERVLVREAATRLEVVPAEYKTLTEQVLVKPQSTRIEKVPATYRTESERVLVTPARTEWKRGPAASFASGGSSVIDSRTTDTGEIMCLVEVPAVYKTVSREVVATAATTREIVEPAVYKTVTKQVVAKPATTREVTIPAEYDTVKTTRIATPASERRITIPAEYTTITKREKVSEETLDWREVVCDVNLTRGNVSELQTSLNKAGYYKGPIDGIIGPMTLSAANGYAKAKGLPVGSNYISIDTIKNLGLNF
ncbi:MAG: peptidoglycan-binding protein [Pseudomonadota bacterium]